MSSLIRVFVLLFGVLIYSQDTLSVKDGEYGYDQDFKLDVNLKTESDIKALQFDLILIQIILLTLQTTILIRIGWDLRVIIQ
jgi:hypothetical protein